MHFHDSDISRSNSITYGSLSDTSFTVNSRDYTINGVQLREPAGDGNPRLSLAT